MSKYHKHICPSCGKYTHEEDGFPYGINVDTGKHYCLDCGLKLGMVEPMEYLILHGIGVFHHATYKDGIINVFRKWGRGFKKYELMIFEEATA